MLDVHPPHEAAHSWRDILIHLATITVGLFIALTLEGCVEWQHHRHLMHEARENIRTEMEDNQKELRNGIESIHQEQKDLKQDIEQLSRLREDPAMTGTSVSLRMSNAELRNTSWTTARETTALSYMPYPEVKRYADVYDLQSLFVAESSRVSGAYAQSFEIFAVFDLDKNATKEQKRGDIDQAIRKLLAVHSELLIYDSMAEELNRRYSKLLAGQS